MQDVFLKEHLVSHHYHWPADMQHAVYTGEPGRRSFDRFNGDQVLYLINYFGQSVGKLSLTDGQKLEELILQQLPADVKSEKSVFHWLRGIYFHDWN